mmetsp:Transcript_22433/g.53336  ORF Transcript_22433/g.53336 Transcript_22433/m.53336 type:complete len:90 (+) Transcript_22433:200-469(+)
MMRNSSRWYTAARWIRSIFTDHATTTLAEIPVPRERAPAAATTTGTGTRSIDDVREKDGGRNPIHPSIDRSIDRPQRRRIHHYRFAFLY